MQYDIIGGAIMDEEDIKFFTIGNLIELCLEHLDKPFRFLGTDYTVGDLHSWRGSYDLPAISYENGNKVGSVIAQRLVMSLADVHYGWKGGEYMYTRNNEFYVAKQRDSDEYKVCGYEIKEGEVILLTKLDPY